MAESNFDTIAECKALIRFDLDAIGAYDDAIAAAKQPIRDQLIAFRADHERHVAELSAVVSRLGGRPPRLPGVRGLIRRTMTRAAGLLGTEFMLRVMRSNEEVLNRQYRLRTERELPREVHDLIERNYADEQRHLAWVEEALKSRIWQQQPAPGPAA